MEESFRGNRPGVSHVLPFLPFFFSLSPLDDVVDVLSVPLLFPSPQLTVGEIHCLSNENE